MVFDAFPVKYIPEWFPWIEFHQVAKEAREVSHALRYEMYELIKKKIVCKILHMHILSLMVVFQSEGSLKESMTSIFLAENTGEDGSVDDEADFCAATAMLLIGEFFGLTKCISIVSTFRHRCR